MFKIKTFPFPFFGLLLAVLFVLALNDGAKGQCEGYQRVYASSEEANSNRINHDVTNANDAVGDNLSDFSSISIPLILGTRYQRLKFPETFVNSEPIHIKLASSINLSVLAITIEAQAYKAGNPVGTKVVLSSGILLNLLAGENVSDIVITDPGTSYDAVQVTLRGGLLSDGKINIYAAYVNKAATADINCNVVEDVITGSTSGLLSILNKVIDSNFAVDADLLSYAEIRQNVGVVGYVHLTTLFSSPSVAGDSISVLFSVPGSSLLDAQIFTKLSVVAYLGNTQVATMPADDLLLGIRLFDATNHIYRFTYAVGSPFDRISIQAGGLVSAFTSVYVYDIKRITPKPAILIDAAVLASKVICSGQNTTLAIDDIQACTTYKWYDAATAGNVVFTGTSFARNLLAVGTYTYYVEAIRQGCTASASARTPVTITVVALPTIAFNTPPMACIIIPNAALAYTASTDAVTYSINWVTPGLGNITNATLPATSIITLPIPNTATIGTYSGTITVKNSTGCSSGPVSFDLVIHAKPSAPLVNISSN